MKLLVALLFVFVTFNSHSQPSQTIAIRSVTVIDGNGGLPGDNQTVIIRDGRINQIGNASEIRVPRNSISIDGTGKYLLPGFIDSNVHASIYGGTSRPETIVKYEDRNADLVLEFVQIALKYGVTTIRDSFGALLPLIEVRDKIERGETVGPRMLVAGNIVGWGGPFSVT